MTIPALPPEDSTDWYAHYAALDAAARAALDADDLVVPIANIAALDVRVDNVETEADALAATVTAVNNSVVDLSGTVDGLGNALTTLDGNVVKSVNGTTPDGAGNVVVSGGGGGGGATTDASDLTEGILPAARIGDASITAAKLDFDVATQAELDAVAAAKANLASPTFTGTVTLPSSVVVPDGTLAIADTSGLQAALDAKAPLASPTFTGTVSGVTKTHVGLGNVDNTSDANKPVSTAQQTALNLKANLASPTFTGTVTLPSTVSIPDGTLAIADTSGLQTALDGKIASSLVDAAGDLLVGTADNTVGRLAKGTALQTLRVNSGATALEWAAPSGGGGTLDAVMSAGVIGQWYGAAGFVTSSFVSTSVPAGTLVMSTPVIAQKTITISQIATYIGTAGTNVRVGLYTFGTTDPFELTLGASYGTLVEASGSLSAAATGGLIFTLASPAVIPAGTGFGVATVPQGGALSLYLDRNNDITAVPWGSSGPLNGPNLGVTQTGVTGAMPSSLTPAAFGPAPGKGGAGFYKRSA